MSNNKAKTNQQIALTIGLKINQLRRNKLPNLEVKHFVDYLYKYKWKKAKPETFTKAISDIMEIEADNMVVYLSQSALIDAKHRSLADFDDLLR